MRGRIGILNRRSFTGGTLLGAITTGPQGLSLAGSQNRQLVTLQPHCRKGTKAQQPRQQNHNVACFHIKVPSAALIAAGYSEPRTDRSAAGFLTEAPP